MSDYDTAMPSQEDAPASREGGYDDRRSPRPERREEDSFGRSNGGGDRRDDRDRSPVDDRDRRRDRSPSPRRRPPPPPPGRGEAPESNVLGCFGLSIRTRDVDLEDEFSRYGRVEKAVIVYDQRSERSRGFGFVTMSTQEEAAKCIEKLNGIELHGRNIRVAFSMTQKPHQSTPGEYMGFKTRGDGGRGPPPRYDDRRRDDRDRYRDDRYSRDDRDRSYRRDDRDRDRDYRRRDDYDDRRRRDDSPPRRRDDRDHDRSAARASP